ncbi:PEP-CTERM sorting domain-containing protein [Luteitalea sp. TBR-22]
MATTAGPPPVPEPSTTALLGTALAVALAARRR